jgi:hypothetical protein
MKVVGILAKSHTSDDLAVFVDLKTVWIIQGLMHGHQDVTKTTDLTVLLKKTDNNVTANAKLFQYAEITEENIDSFHFHGDTSKYPITAVIAVPYDGNGHCYRTRLCAFPEASAEGDQYYFQTRLQQDDDSQDDSGRDIHYCLEQRNPLFSHGVRS